MPQDVINKDVLNLKNGFLNPVTKELFPHSPERFSTLQLPVIYDPMAECPKIKTLINQLFMVDTIPIVQEYIGYLLMPHTELQKALMLAGSNSKGKLQFIDLISELIGIKNFPSLALDDPFEIWWKGPDLCQAVLQSNSHVTELISLFKAIISCNLTDADFKEGEPSDFKQFVRLLSSFKNPVDKEELSEALFKHLIVIPLANEPDQGVDADSEFLSEIKQPEELSGLFNWALAGLSKLVVNGTFTESYSAEIAMYNFVTPYAVDEDEELS